jgi:hypothetical protein
MVNTKPPKDLTSFEGRKWLQQITKDTETDPVAMQYLDQSVKIAATPTFDGAIFTNDITLKAGCKIFLDGE